ncbi:MAG: 30S ribosomal protein S6 [Candidatus Sumerlaeota bacterium]|nr:30S ribosomal protein S6 [Candidatus Sumerlaeota bacterium]
MKSKDYELVVILDGTQPDDQVRAAVERLREILLSHNVELTYVEEWGRRRMAFPIKKKVEGFYVIYYFRVPDADSPLEDVKKFARITDIVLRQLAVRVPKLKTEADARREEALREAERKAAEEAQRKPAVEEKPPAEEKTAAEEKPAEAGEQPAAPEAPATAPEALATEPEAPAVVNEFSEKTLDDEPPPEKDSSVSE